MEKKYRDSQKVPARLDGPGKEQISSGQTASQGRRTFRRMPSALDVHYHSARGDLRGLIDLLRYQDALNPGEAVQVRRAAASVLPELHDRRAVDGLISALSDSSPSVQVAAAEGLGRLASVIPVTSKAAATSGLTRADRTRILAALFPLVRGAQVERVDLDVLSAAAEAIFRTGGKAVLRPLLAFARQSSLAFQSWFVRWAVRSHQDELLIDLYPWAKPDVRALIVERLRARLTQPVLRRLESAEQPCDADLEELIQHLFG